MKEPDFATLLLTLAQERGPGKTFCPSEAARRADPENWRDLMDAVRKAASKLPDLKVTQGGQSVDPITAKGPIRLGLKDTGTTSTPVAPL